MLAIIFWPLSGSGGVVTCCVTHIWRTTFLSSWCWMSIFFLFIFVFTYLDLLTYAKQTNHWEKKNEKKTENVINSDLTLGVKGGLGKQRHWQKESGWKQLQTMRNTKLVAFPHCIHMHNHTCIQSHTHSSQRQRQHSCVSLCLWDVEEENESWREQLLGGGGWGCAVPTDHSGKNASLVLVCWAVTF